jgi:hypothetical protein
MCNLQCIINMFYIQVFLLKYSGLSVWICRMRIVGNNTLDNISFKSYTLTYVPIRVEFACYTYFYHKCITNDTLDNISHISTISADLHKCTYNYGMNTFKHVYSNLRKTQKINFTHISLFLSQKGIQTATHLKISRCGHI